MGQNLLNLAPIDNLDDRREVMFQLSKLNGPTERIAFLEWAVLQANQALKIRPRPGLIDVHITNTTGTLEETYFDLMCLIVDFDLPIPAVLAELERRASEAKKLWLPAA